jgi:NADH dehydrogenase FAD-containing subunit
VPTEDAVNASTAGSSGPIVVAGAGYARLHVALRLTARLRDHPGLGLTLAGRHDYHQRSPSCPGSPAAPAPPTHRST